MKSFTIAAFAALLASGALAAAPLITNGDFSSGYSGFSTDYTYAAPYTGGVGALWTPGVLTVATNPYDVHDLWASFSDVDGGGNMLIANGALDATMAVWSENVTLVADGSYEFSFWGASSYFDSPAVIQLLVNGAPQGAASDLSSTPGLWQQFSGSFIAPSGGTQLSLVDLNTASSGNDFVLDNIALVTPEPGTFTLIGLGLVAASAALRRRSRKSN
jgi:hypothetical protein